MQQIQELAFEWLLSRCVGRESSASIVIYHEHLNEETGGILKSKVRMETEC